MATTRLLGGLAAFVLLAGCAGAPVVRPATIDSYTPQYAASMSQLELIGTAAGANGTAELAAVAAKGIAQGSTAGPQFTLRPRGPEDPQMGRRVVVEIRGGDGGTLCAAPPQQGGEFKGESLSVTAAACDGPSRLSSTSGSVSGVSGPSDPGVAHLFRQIGAELFPMRNPNYDHGHDVDWND